MARKRYTREEVLEILFADKDSDSEKSNDESSRSSDSDSNDESVNETDVAVNRNTEKENVENLSEDVDDRDNELDDGGLVQLDGNNEITLHAIGIRTGPRTQGGNRGGNRSLKYRVGRGGILGKRVSGSGARGIDDGVGFTDALRKRKNDDPGEALLEENWTDVDCPPNVPLFTGSYGLQVALPEDHDEMYIVDLLLTQEFYDLIVLETN